MIKVEIDQEIIRTMVVKRKDYKGISFLSHRKLYFNTKFVLYFMFYILYTN